MRLSGWIPPNLVTFADRLRRGRSGLGVQLSTWEEARQNAGRYDDDVILQRVHRAAQRSLANGQAGIFERDGVILADQGVPLALGACLLRTAMVVPDGINVFDFGGALGSTFLQFASFLSVIKKLRWHVIEQAAFVQCGKANYESEQLRFFDSLEAAASVAKPDVVLFSSVLQYLDDPYDILSRSMKLQPAAIVVDRNPVYGGAEDAFTIQYVPPDIFPARLPFRIFGEHSIARHVASAYREVLRFNAIDPNMTAGLIDVRFCGFLFEKAV